MKSVALLSLVLDNKRSNKTTLKVLMGINEQEHRKNKTAFKKFNTGNI